MASENGQGRHSSAGRKARQEIRVTGSDDHFRGLIPKQEDGPIIVDFETVIKEDNRIIGYYNPKLPDQFQDCFKLFHTLDFDFFHNKKELHFGMRPNHSARNWIKGEFENNTKLLGAYAVVSQIADTLQEKIERLNPKSIAKGVEQVVSSYTKTIGDTYYNHAILMQNTMTPYHKDSPCFIDVWSILCLWSGEIEGGELIFPTLKLRFKPQGYIICPSAELTHGVSQTIIKQGGYRYSLLIYLDKAVLR